jgi:hypothetical protein
MVAMRRLLSDTSHWRALGRSQVVAILLRGVFLVFTHMGSIASLVGKEIKVNRQIKFKLDFKF